MKDRTPNVSIVVIVFNGENYICEAIESLLNQTYQNFEIIVVNDGSIDQTSRLLAQYSDDRIVVLHNQQNLGITKTRNIGVGHARGRYIAVMDCDDLSHSTRLEEQVRFLNENPQYAMVSSWAHLINGDSFEEKSKSIWRFSPTKDCIAPYLLFQNCIVHSSVMMRAACLPEPAYREFEPAEDYDLWVRLAKTYKIKILPKPLVSYRVHNASASKLQADKQNRQISRIVQRQLRELDIDPTDENLKWHVLMARESEVLGKRQMVEVRNWLLFIKQMNKASQVYDEAEMDTAIGKHWMTICKEACKKNPLSFFNYLFSDLGKGHRIDFVQSAFRWSIGR